MSPEEIPAPPSARKGVAEGAYEVRLDAATAEARRALAEKYGDSDVTLYALPPDAEWNGVSSFYEAQLGAKGLKRDTSFPAEHATHKLAVWAGPGGQAVAVAFVEAGRTLAGSPLKFLAVFVTRE